MNSDVRDILEIGEQNHPRQHKKVKDKYLRFVF